MERIGVFIGKSFHTIKSYRGLQREISPVDSVGIQAVTRLIADEEGIDNFVDAGMIYPELYQAFKQGPHQEDSLDGTEANKGKSHNSVIPGAKGGFTQDGANPRPVSQHAA